MSHHYRMTGRIRPLLFWISRDRVGFGRVTWRRSVNGARGYDFLVGTDPATAPRSINRWGYIAEEIGVDGGGTVLAMMSSSEETSFDQARTATLRGQGGREFKALWSRVGAGMALSRLASVQTADAPTIHDVATLLERVRIDTARAPVRQRTLDATVRPGFLGSVADLVNRSLDPGAGATGPRSAVRYAFGQRLYELRIRKTAAVDRSRAPLAVPARRTVFEIRNLATDDRTEFEMTYGSQGHLAGVPLFIAWQPRWWLKVELHVEPEVDATRGLRVAARP
jgi:hypothetical protein